MKCSPENVILLIDPSLRGVVEPFVFSELIKHVDFSDQYLSLWHYRTQNPIEVDFILEDRLGKLTGLRLRQVLRGWREQKMKESVGVPCKNDTSLCFGSFDY